MKRGKKMKDLIGPHWLETEIELMKTIEGYEKKGSNKKSGIIDYVSDEGEKLLRVLLNKKPRGSKAITETVKNAIDSMEEGGYEEAFIIAEEFTYGAKKLIRDTERLGYISRDQGSPHSFTDILSAIQSKMIELCESKCGKYPSTEDECKGYRHGKYSCVVRKISDDADFHAERGWISLLYSDFSKLIKIKGENTGKKRR
jgi:hypothetical protein